LRRALGALASIITFVTGFLTRLSNQVTRALTLRAGATFTPSSPSTRRSGPSWLFAW
jgi:hypothetical protein